jgi:hypothetical protein
MDTVISRATRPGGDDGIGWRTGGVGSEAMKGADDDVGGTEKEGRIRRVKRRLMCGPLLL